MKKIPLKFKVVLLIILTVLFVNVIRTVPAQASYSDAVTYNDNINNSYYENLLLESVFREGVYYAVTVMKYNDSMNNYVLLTSTDNKRWKIEADLSEKNEEVLEKPNIRLLNNIFVISSNPKNGFVKYISTDGQEWEQIDLQYEDLVYYADKYWALNSEGTVYSSKNLMSWEHVVSLESSSMNELIAVNLSVNDDMIIVSHYSPKWGSHNYKNGLEVYDSKQKLWMETTGYSGLTGASIDIVNTGQQFILTYQNDYSYDDPILYYTSQDGINWSLNENKPDILRSFNALTAQDSTVYRLVDIVRTQIVNYALNGGNTQVQVQIDGVEIEFDQDAVLVNGRVLVPVRKIFESLDGTVTFNQEKKEVLGKIGEQTISMTLGEKTATVNGVSVPLDVPAQIMNNRTLVPVRFIADCISKEVIWDQENYIVHLKSK